MNIAKGSGAPFKLSAITSGGRDIPADLEQVKEKLASGALLPDAPCAAMYNAWSDAEKHELKTALSKVFGIPMDA